MYSVITDQQKPLYLSPTLVDSQSRRPCMSLSVDVFLITQAFQVVFALFPSEYRTRKSPVAIFGHVTYPEGGGALRSERRREGSREWPGDKGPDKQM